MRAFLFNLALVSCSLFIFLVNADDHPHKSDVIHHGPSLENYQIELNFSTKHMIPDGSKSNFKIANKNKKTDSSTKPVKNKTTLDKEQIQKKQKGLRK